MTEQFMFHFSSTMQPLPLTRTTHLNQLPPSALFKLRTQLDYNDKWKELAAAIVNRHGQPKYKVEDVMSFELEIHKGRSPTEALLQDWGHDNTTVQDLLKVLWEIHHYNLMHFLLVKYMEEMAEDEFCKQLEKGWEGLENKYVIKHKGAEEFVESRDAKTVESTERDTEKTVDAERNTEETMNVERKTAETVNAEVERNTEETVNADRNTEETVNAERNTEETINPERNTTERVYAEGNTAETVNAEVERITEETVNAERNTREKVESAERTTARSLASAVRNKAKTVLSAVQKVVGFPERNAADAVEPDKVAKNESRKKRKKEKKLRSSIKNADYGNMSFVEEYLTSNKTVKCAAREALSEAKKKFPFMDRSSTMQASHGVSFVGRSGGVQNLHKTIGGNHQLSNVPMHPESQEEGNSNRIMQYKYDDLTQLTDNWNMQPLRQGGRLLGTGGYAMVFLAKPSTQKNMAVKFLENKDNAHKQFFQEVDILVKFVHPNIVPLFGVSQDGPNWCIVYEYMENGSLEDRLDCKDKTTPLTGRQRSQVAKDVAQGLNFLHTRNKIAFVHRDVKTANILLHSDFSAKIGDCGLAHRGPIDTEKTHTTTNNIIGTKCYCAPEYLRHEISVKLDAYSFGMMLYEMLTGLAVFDECREEPFLKEHVEKGFADHGLDSIQYLVDLKLYEWKKENVAPVFDTACRLTTLDKKQRPKIEEVLQEIMEWPQEW